MNISFLPLQTRIRNQKSKRRLSLIYQVSYLHTRSFVSQFLYILVCKGSEKILTHSHNLPVLDKVRCYLNTHLDLSDINVCSQQQQVIRHYCCNEDSLNLRRTRAKGPNAQSLSQFPQHEACLGVLLLPPGRNASPSQGYPPVACRGYPFIRLDEERQSGVKFLA